MQGAKGTQEGVKCLIKLKGARNSKAPKESQICGGKPCCSKEVHNGRVSPGHRFGNSLVGQFSAAVQVEHFEIPVLAHGHSDIRLLQTK